VSRQSKELWKLVLSDQNEHRKEIVDQVITTELPGSKNPEEVIIAVQSFM
jgi:clathrin heavy chain